VQPPGVVAGGDQQRGGAVGADAVQVAQLGSVAGGEGVELLGEQGDLGVEVLVALAQAAQGQPDRRGRGGQRAHLELGGGTDQPAGGQATQLLAELGWGGDQQPLEGVDGLGAGLDRGLAGGAERAQHLHHPVLGLGDPGGFAGLDRAGGGIGVDRIALAAPPPSLPVGPVDLHDPLAVAGQEAGQPGAVAAGALHAPGGDLAQGVGPGQQLRVAGAAGRHLGRAKPAAELVTGGGDVGVLVGVDPDGDPRRCGVCHGGDRHPLEATRAGGRTGRAGGQHCEESGCNRLLSGHALSGRCCSQRSRLGRQGYAQAPGRWP